ncbi:SDR family oxidoreductase [Streptomyces sp. NPDC006798]|uniref:SDR family NAD(P)-dependent oxidoreductase n=1 Tax=Streptomyces sp. NPDC006798 TaxID=3155462 RepID=UPI0033DAE85D
MARTVVISGGGTGIGLAAADVFAADGDRVVLLGRRADVLARAAGSLPGAAYHPADLSVPDDVRRAAAFVEREYGTVDVLAHCAGGDGLRTEPGTDTDTEPRAPGPDETGLVDPLAAVADAWERNFRLNTLTAVLLTEALREHLATPGGRVLFVSSIAAYRGSGRAAGYGAAKAALHPYAFRLARELGPRGITVNAVAPGLVEETDFFGEPLPEERRAALAAETATGRVGHPGDVSRTLHWLASTAAAHITAQIVQINGGAERGH